jgi:hypothetical protein
MRRLSPQSGVPVSVPNKSVVPQNQAPRNNRSIQNGPLKGFHPLNTSSLQHTSQGSPPAQVQTLPSKPAYNSTACSAGDSNTCITCGANNPLRADYCIKCGSKLTTSNTQPTSTHSPVPLPAIFANRGAPALAFSPGTWVIVAGAAIILILICFFLPLNVISINNPFALFYGGPEQIHISMSSMQILTMSSPSISGLGGLGETVENLYGELNYWQYMFESGDIKYKVSIILEMLAMLYLVICTITGLIFAYKYYQTRNTSYGKKMLVLGITAVTVLIISSLVINISFNTGSSDLDMVLDSVITFSNGFGFWGLLVGFALYSFAGFKISKS